jgi:hypothetical protein
MWKGGRSSKGWTVDSKSGWVDKNGWVFTPQARKLVLQVSKIVGDKGQGGWVGMNFILCVNTVIYELRITRLCFQVKNKPCARRIVYMSLISWIHPRGSGT